MRKIVLGMAGALALSAAAWAQTAPSPAPTGAAATATSTTPRPQRPPRAPPIVPAASLLMSYKSAAAPALPNEPYGGVAGVGLNSKGHLFVWQRKAPALIEYDAKGALVSTHPTITQTRAHSLRIDASDNIWIVDDTAQTVTKLDPTGDKVLLTLGEKGQAGTWNEAAGVRRFNQPTDIAFGANGDLFVSTGHGGPDPRIVHFDKTGKFINTWALTHDDGTPATIHTIAIGKDGNVYAGDREVMTLRVFTPAGAHVRDIKLKNLICGLTVDSKGELWMTAGYDGMVMRLSWDGDVLGWTGKPGKGDNEYGEAHYLTMSKDNSTLYVSDPTNAKLQKLVK